MADLSLKDLFEMAGEWKGSNIGYSPLTYLNPRAQLSYSPFGGAMFGLKPAQGWVTHLPGLNNNINFSRKHLPRDQRGYLELLAHESAHTTQPMEVKHKFDSLLSSAPYTGYGDNSFPPAQEILASLREKEAMARKGKQWTDTLDGGDYLEELMKANPKQTRQDIVQHVDRKMFPEFGVMHESPAKIRPLQQQQGFLQQLMQMFGR